MFDMFTYSALRAMFYASYNQAMAFGDRHGELMTAVADARDPHAAAALLNTANVVLAAMDEQQGLVHAIREEMCARNAITEQHQMGITDE